jgi:hypothetical protein
MRVGQSLVKNYIHIVFSTKYRQPMIIPSIEAELYYSSGKHWRIRFKTAADARRMLIILSLLSCSFFVTV